MTGPLDAEGNPTCGARAIAHGGIPVWCGRPLGHDKPRPVEDWAVCATCGGNRCKSASRADPDWHKFTPAVTGYTYEPHRFWVEWPSGPLVTPCSVDHAQLRGSACPECDFDPLA